MLQRAAARAVVVALAAILVLAGCGPTTEPSATPGPSLTAVPTIAPSAVPSPTPAYGLGRFPAFPTAQLSADAGARLQAILDTWLATIDAPGLGAAVVLADRGTWVGATGTADGSAPLDPRAQFGIGSITKMIVAAQVLQLVEAGAVELDRPIAEYVGEDLATNGATVRQILSHRSGVGDPTVDPADACADQSRSLSLADLRTVTLGPPFFAAGERFRYTNANYLFAGLLVEAVTDRPIADVLRSGVLSSPGLERLVYQDVERPSPPLAGPFIVRPGSDSVPPPNEILELGLGFLPTRCLASMAGPAGGIASDALTLARFGYLLFGGSILGQEALAEMTDFQGGYGLGTHEQRRFSSAAVGHEGQVPGYTAVLWAFPADGLVVTVLTNTELPDNDLTSVAGRLRDAVAD